MSSLPKLPKARPQPFKLVRYGGDDGRWCTPDQSVHVTQYKRGCWGVVDLFNFGARMCETGEEARRLARRWYDGYARPAHFGDT